VRGNHYRRTLNKYLAFKNKGLKIINNFLLVFGMFIGVIFIFDISVLALLAFLGASRIQLETTTFEDNPLVFNIVMWCLNTVPYIVFGTAFLYVAFAGFNAIEYYYKEKLETL
jgi:hypothetical protein